MRPHEDGNYTEEQQTAGYAPRLTETQIAILFVLDQTYLCKQWDDMWWPAGSPSDQPRFSQDDVRHLVRCGFAHMLPIGCFPTDKGRDHLRALHLIK